MIIDGISLKVGKCSTDSFTVKSIPNDYTVEFVNETTADTLARYLDNKLVVIDRKVAELYGVDVNRDNVWPVDANEQNKTVHRMLDLCEELEKCSFRKKDTLVVVGGGITQDIAGMAAKLFKRGINWTFIPTTLLSMCDSCIGGKAAVNFNKTKNQLALFTAPQRVVINTKFTDTLPLEDIHCGIGEIVKLYALAGQSYVDRINFDYWSKSENFPTLIKQALLIKKAVIEHDEFEKNIRKSLNYGHTFGHAIESAMDYDIPHGIAIIYGMFIVNKLFNENESLNTALKTLISGEGLDEILRTSKLTHILELVRKDKKNVDDKLMLVRVPTCGECVFDHVSVDDELINKLRAIKL
jgi:3-dehydroquinate synthase